MKRLLRIRMDIGIDMPDAPTGTPDRLCDTFMDGVGREIADMIKRQAVIICEATMASVIHFDHEVENSDYE